MLAWLTGRNQVHNTTWDSSLMQLLGELIVYPPAQQIIKRGLNDPHTRDMDIR
jgi:hypothetical protein